VGITLKRNGGWAFNYQGLASSTLFPYSSQAPNFQELIKWTRSWFKNSRISGYFVPEGAVFMKPVDLLEKALQKTNRA
jgi:hypothetical protein